MKKLAICLLFLVLGCSCEDEGDNGGWPRKVMFTKEGGEITVTGSGATNWYFIKDGDVSYVDDTPIGNGNGEVCKKKDDWLTIKYYKNGGYVKIKAEPLSGDKMRNFGICAGARRGLLEIGIYQYPKDSVQLGLKPKS